jgi:hypothetical protein
MHGNVEKTARRLIEKRGFLFTCSFFLTGVMPVSKSLGMYLQEDKPLFPLPLVYIIPPEELLAPAAEHETAPEGPIKR